MISANTNVDEPYKFWKEKLLFWGGKYLCHFMRNFQVTQGGGYDDARMKILLWKDTGTHLFPKPVLD